MSLEEKVESEFEVCYHLICAVSQANNESKKGSDFKGSQNYAKCLLCDGKNRCGNYIPSSDIMSNNISELVEFYIIKSLAETVVKQYNKY